MKFFHFSTNVQQYTTLPTKAIKSKNKQLSWRYFYMYKFQ